MTFEGVLNTACIWFCGAASGSVAPNWKVESTTEDEFDFRGEVETNVQLFLEEIAAAIKDDASCLLIRYRTLAGNLNINFFDEPNEVEGEIASEAPFPGYVSLLLKKTDASDYGRGKAYLPFPPSQMILEGDLVDSENESLVAAANAFASNYTTGGTTIYPCIWHKAANAYIAVTGCFPANYVSHRKWRGVNHFQSNP